MEVSKPKTSSIDSSFPISIPENKLLTLPEEDFRSFFEAFTFAKDEVDAAGPSERNMEVDVSEAVEAPPTDTSTQISGFSDLEIVSIPDKATSTITGEALKQEGLPSPTSSNAFIDGLKSYKESTTPPPESMENKMLTENGDITNRSSKDPLVDLFFELEDLTRGRIVRSLLEVAWAHDKQSTLKIIFNARSIHLGKASRNPFYQCCAWLGANHPKTLLSNIEWLCRPIIEKPKPKKTDETDSAKLNSGEMATEVKPDLNIDAKETIAETTAETQTAVELLEQGLAHGYWKDLLNILALSANKLTVLDSPKDVLNVKVEPKKRKHDWDHQSAKKTRDARKHARHENVVNLFQTSPFYRLLHIQVARLFAQQLKIDKERLQSGKKSDLQSISLAAKWAPTLGGFHDSTCFIASSIAEILCPTSDFPEVDGREMYLKNARERYRYVYLSPLRKFLAVVERDITAKTYDKINYQRVPSLAMQKHSKLFMKNDTDRFDEFLDQVGEGTANISGATLLPSTLVSALRRGIQSQIQRSKGPISKLAEQRDREMAAKVINGQWVTLVQRIKDSGSLSSAIAVCDVSGSMQHPKFGDRTTPMDSAIGLSLLLAEVTEPPFGGHFITFSANPRLESIGDGKNSLMEKVKALESSEWGMNTDFEAVFSRLILPMAKSNKLTQDQMVKTIFVFSDMHFDSAQGGGRARWSSTFERIKREYQDAGYELPQLVFWNLAGGRSHSNHDDPTAPKPVTANEEGTALVSGYSQGQLKVFLDGAGFEDPGTEEDVETVEEEDEEGLVNVTKKKTPMNPLSIVMKAIGHPAYAMLKIID